MNLNKSMNLNKEVKMKKRTRRKRTNLKKPKKLDLNPLHLNVCEAVLLFKTPP
jgi:hypothetical protein